MIEGSVWLADESLLLDQGEDVGGTTEVAAEFAVVPAGLLGLDASEGVYEVAAGGLYAGRLTEEKGLARLVSSWPNGRHLDVAGGGPMEADLNRLTRGEPISMLGTIDHGALLRSLSSYKGLIIPSMWAEGMPTIALEALSFGVPIVAGSESSVGDVVRACRVGRVLNPSEWTETSLLDALTSIERSGQELRDECRRVHAARFSDGIWLDEIERVYEDSIEAWTASGSQGR